MPSFPDLLDIADKSLNIFTVIATGIGWWIGKYQEKHASKEIYFQNEIDKIHKEIKDLLLLVRDDKQFHTCRYLANHIRRSVQSVCQEYQVRDTEITHELSKLFIYATGKGAYQDSLDMAETCDNLIAKLVLPKKKLIRHK
ncbi:hypothetical protein QGZ99_06855 [Kingella kingae]|uniref:Uncharacterized protein n=2 Tax=Kingella kingae TaxID=504 RepID=F5S5D9_KINKI|nr:hypothetical protein [Kingella kingae]EGK11307.1 hypothetical protein HMPREF0476_0422 [Kingella kingae ATCC 23330]MDK4534790.1 hypothetical protein [Kingella kingae]MDK4541259.1 hypothetical protein [Kingella kingae]MDK4553828.1 hypothetical protein [Kingella kingae]UOP03640.1 hypothetical protein LVJ79_03590 [Kingella kingae]